MERKLLLVMAAVCVIGGGCGGKDSGTSADYIGIDAAKETALRQAGVSLEQADFQTAGLDSRDGTFFYQVVFTQDGTEYRYDIDALTGVVIQESRSSQAEEKESGGSLPPAGGEISADGALAAALAHAGLTEADISYSKVETDVDHGQNIFDVELILMDGTEYDYEISRMDGSVLSYDLDAEASFPRGNSGGAGTISESQAKKTVMSRIPGVKEEDVSIWMEEDDGRLEYEGRVFYDNMEYEFKIDPYSGGVMEWEAEAMLY